MTQLKCDAIHCISNRDGCCCRPDIQVGGANATQQQETCCESFRYVENSSNAVDYSHVNETMPIRCEATNCVYNQNRQCVADAIRVGGHSAQKMEQTDCETFRCENSK